MYSTPETDRRMATRADDPTKMIVREAHLYSWPGLISQHTERCKAMDRKKASRTEY